MKRNFLSQFWWALIVGAGGFLFWGEAFAVSNSAAVVGIAIVDALDMPIEVHALGSLSAAQRVMISSEVPGRVAKQFFTNGQQVGQNMPIIQLENAKVQADYQSAVSALNLSRMKYQRSKLLVNEAVSEEQLETLRADVEAKQAGVQSSLVALNQKTITAPFEGILGKFNVQVGDYVNAGDSLVTLTNATILQVNYNVPESQLSGLALGQSVKITSDAYPDQIFYGTVSFISPTINDTTRAVALQATVQNPNNRLVPGMFVHVTQIIGIQKNVMVVPQQAVVADVKGYYVYRVNNNKVSVVYVKRGDIVGNRAEILSGLQQGDTVVVAGTQKLADGMMIQVGS